MSTTAYIPHTKKDIEEMLSSIGLKSLDELSKSIPNKLLLKEPLKIKDGLSEQALLNHLNELAAKNTEASKSKSFLGAGAYSHYTPALVDQLLLRSEFYTAYTPYQPEISQGTLQAIFEYQTMICQLTKMEVSNASLYDGGSAVAEAALMACRINKKHKVIISEALHPEYKQILRTYLAETDDSVVESPIDKKTGQSNIKALIDLIDDDTTCLIVQSPNFFGVIEDIEELGRVLHEKNVLLVQVVTEALSLAMLKPPGEMSVDIVVGEAQSFGAGLNFGGPHIGFLATRQKFLRNMPGRLCGETVDKNGKRAYCLTLSTREQHIRREKATSNICTNQGLIALAVTIYLSALGKNGLMDLARTNLSKANYLSKKLKSIMGVELAFKGPVFNEFTIDLGVKKVDSVLKRLQKKGILAGVKVDDFMDGFKNHLIVCATEMNSKRDMDDFVAELKRIYS